MWIKLAELKYFQVNADNSYVSFLTMIGPSPDWCVGKDSVQLCSSSSCEWINETTSELYPIDMGTDDGVSFLSKNKPRSTFDKIQMIRPSTNPDSPFSGKEIKSFAQFRMTKVEENLIEALSTEKCLYTIWTEWSSCSSSCNWGVKTRMT